MKVTSTLFDVLVIGGGINGVGIAADASGRGLKVALCERQDLAAATSSASTKLIHGGLRYLETYEFGMVTRALKESDRLLGLAPHLIHPICFHIPYMKHHRPWILIRLGLFLYNTLTHRARYKKAGAVRFPPESPLIESLRHGFRYYDGQVDDSRLVILNALQAARQGAEIFTRKECVALHAEGDHWQAILEDRISRDQQQINARTVVNATGPWVSQLVKTVTGESPRHQVRLVKGSHIVVPSMYQGEQAYLLQNEDGRVVFVIPWEQKYSLIGTTEEDYLTDPDKVQISTAETDYLLESVNRYFKSPVAHKDIVYTYSGVRPLIDSEQKLLHKVSRDYQLELENTPLPLLSVYGGKVTTYRLLAQEAVNKLGKFLGRINRSQTAKKVLPGGDFKLREQLFQLLASTHGWLARDLIKRWIVSYGSLSFEILQGAGSIADMGINFGHTLYQREVDYLARTEWARSAEDILWRRSKLGLVFNDEQVATLDDYMRNLVIKREPKNRQYTYKPSGAHYEE